MRLKPSVLAIDDDPFVCQALESVLSRFGLIVKTTSDPKEFIEHAERVKPDLLLVDLQIGDVSGFDLIAKVRPLMPVSIIIVISGSQEKSDIANALELGANDFILKPLNRTLLTSKLSLYLDTEHMKENRPESVPFSDKSVNGTVSIDGKIEEVDELGMKILSPHLIPKGTVLKLGSSFLKQIGVTAPHCLVSVTSTSYDADTELYSIYVEFEESENDIQQELRRWLIQNQQPQSS